MALVEWAIIHMCEPLNGVKMKDRSYIVATTKVWNIQTYNDVIRHYPGKWHLISRSTDLTVHKIRSIKPKYIFFPHWSNIVSDEILDIATCICFHETDLPFGRGGSPIQNLIVDGHKETLISALRMSKDLDAGPIYLKRKLSLVGLAEEIFLRSSITVAQMINTIIIDNPKPSKQEGEVSTFKRRSPGQSQISTNTNLAELFDHIRMLDAQSYPPAFIEVDGFRYEFTRPALKTDAILADVRVTKVAGGSID